MAQTPHRIAALLFAALVPFSACEHGKNSPGQSDVPDEASSSDSAPPPPEEPAEAAPAQPKLANSPDIDLVANRFRWHLYRSGLVIPFASEGLFKYSHEYKQPFGPVVKHADREGRILTKSTMVLRFPWHAGAAAAVLQFYAHGLGANPRVTAELNGERVGTASLSDGWAATSIAIGEGSLRDGENELRLRVSKSARVDGKRTYALWHSLELGPAPSEEFPPLDPAQQNSLRGFPRMRTYLEVPSAAWLEVQPPQGGNIRAHAQGVDTVELLSEAAPAKQLVDLSAVAGKLVVLELQGDGPWLNPRIALVEEELGAKPRTENAILVVVDALRADRLRLYGETRVDTPRLTAAGQHAAVFLSNQAASPSSPPSHTSIQTGMIPRVHGIAGDKGKLVKGTPTLSSQLEAAGIATAYVGNNSFGMSRLAKAGKWTKFTSPLSSGKGPDCEQVIEGVLEFAKAQHAKGKRFFVSALPMEPHAPYRYHEGISDKYHEGAWKQPIGKRVTGYTLEDIVAGRKKMDDQQWSQLHALYDGEVEHMDQCFGMLEDGLAAAGLAESTAIVLTADHGEGMGERERLGHAYGHFGELSNVPFVVFAPALEGPLDIETVTGHLDVAPTVLDLLGVEPSTKIQGASVLPLVQRAGHWTPRISTTEYGRSYALRARGWKLIVDYSGKEKLFDVAADPLDSTDVAASAPLALRYMRDMSGFFLRHRSRWHTSTWGTLNNHSSRFFTLSASN